MERLATTTPQHKLNHVKSTNAIKTKKTKRKTKEETNRKAKKQSENKT